MKILWATTFSADLWEHSASHLVESFQATRTEGRLVAFVEGMDMPTGMNIEAHRIDGDPTLKAFLATHSDVIPEALGGTLTSPECRCSDREKDVHSKHHRLPCPGYWFCKNAYRWLRKPLAAQKACGLYPGEYDILMWVDSDAVFLQQNTAKVVAGWFQDKAACIYLKNKRTAIETGVFGYHLRRGGQLIADKVMGRYTSGRFRKDPRWDDCVQMKHGIYESGKPALDIATAVGPNNTVIQFSPMAEYLAHAKGSNRRKGLLK